MIEVRKKAEIGNGVTADMLFTPRLFGYKGQYGITFEVAQTGDKRKDALAAMELYADIFFCAALNAWVLDGHGPEEDYPHTRGDFHAWMSADPKAFGKCMDFAVRALTGKPLASLPASEEKAPDSPENGVKKKTSRWTGRTWRNFWSAVAGKQNGKRG